MPAPARVLLVEDDETIGRAVSTALTDQGLGVRLVADGRGLEEVLVAFRPDLVLLDWMLPGRDGVRLASVVRRTTDAGIILLTARDEVPDRLRGFSAGADDYVTKPFVMAELVARATAVLRRLGRVPSAVEVGDLLVDEEAGVVSRAGAPVDLTGTELRLLGYLAQNRGRVLSKTQILTQVWGYDSLDPNLVEVCVSALRRKVEAGGDRLIHTVRGVGYVLRA